jgi:hypothetical protein
MDAKNRSKNFEIKFGDYEIKFLSLHPLSKKQVLSYGKIYDCRDCIPMK